MLRMSIESPANITRIPGTAQTRLLRTLRTIDFPATKDDLLRIAVLDHLEVATIDALRDLPVNDYHGTAEVLRALGSDDVDSDADYAMTA